MADVLSLRLLLPHGGPIFSNTYRVSYREILCCLLFKASISFLKFTDISKYVELLMGTLRKFARNTLDKKLRKIEIC